MREKEGRYGDYDKGTNRKIYHYISKNIKFYHLDNRWNVILSRIIHNIKSNTPE